MDSTDFWTPLTLDALRTYTPSGIVDDSFKDALGGLSLHPVQDTTEKESIEERRQAPETTSGNPLVDPTIPLEDTETSFTPATLSEMHQLQNEPSIHKRLRFLDLPSEIRNLVYAELLTPGCDAAMDFAPCADCSHEYNRFTRREARDPEERAEGIEWYMWEWRGIKNCLRAISLVSPQVGGEASTVFWSQPFRFTSDLGWVMLYHFLEKIGPTNLKRLKNITVCHPAFSVTPDSSPSREAISWWGFATPGPDYYDLFQDHLQLFRLGKPFVQPYAQMSGSEAWFLADSLDGPLQFLERAENLTKLAFTLPQFQNPGEQPSFQDLIHHPIQLGMWPQEDLSIRVIHLAPSVYCWTNLSLEDIYNNVDHTVEFVYKLDPYQPFPQQGVHEIGRAAMARSYFEEVK